MRTQHAFDLAVGLPNVPSVVITKSARAALLCRRPLRRQALARLGLGHPARDEPRDLHLRRTRRRRSTRSNCVSRAGFVQQRDVDDRERMSPSSSKPCRPAVIARYTAGCTIASSSRRACAIGEDDRAELARLTEPSAARTSAPKRARDRGGRLGARGHHAVGQRVGVEARRCRACGAGRARSSCRSRFRR